VGKFRHKQRIVVQSIVADLTIKGIPDKIILQHIENQTGETISDRSLRNIRERIKRDSFDWYCKLKSSRHEYIHQFRQRVAEISNLQSQHHEIISKNTE
jgi:hypothetical protein